MTTNNPKNETHIKCTTCNDEICNNTDKVLTYCSCGAVSVDGCADYVRVGGDASSYVEIEK